MDNILSSLAAHSQNFPDRPAVYFLESGEPTTITYGNLYSRAKQFAAFFRANGLKKGSVVFLILKHHRENYEAFLGAMMAGYIPSILPFPTPKQHHGAYWDSHRKLFERVRPGYILTYDENIEPLSTIISAELGTKIGLVNSIVLPEGIADSEVQDPDDAIALLQHSSGTTGLKKGVMLTFAEIREQLSPYAERLGFSGDDIVISWLPLYHDMGLISSFLMPLIAGSSIVSIDPFEWVNNPEIFLECVESYRGTFAWLPNFAFSHIRQFVHNFGKEKRDLSSLRAVISCSEPVRATTLAQFTDFFSPWGLSATAPQACYAMAETVFAVSQTSLEEAFKVVWVRRDKIELPSKTVELVAADVPCAVSYVSNGRPIDGLCVRIATPLGTYMLTKGGTSPSAGEIQISGTCVFSGYYLNHADSAAAFTEDGWYRTGDVGFTVDGELYICGREKELLIIHGKNYYVGDIEQCVSAVPGVKPGRAVVFTVFDIESDSESCIIMAETEETDPIKLRDIKRSVKQEVYRAIVLTVRTVDLVPLGTLAKTTSGKMSRSQNQDIWMKSRNKS
ncbi:AMP-binding protein [Agrobacterium tumefaciens]|uniref:AMP-binding protein n=1 Tax=Agrobacterium tumefaciens TaxID=358 RepID=UPI003458A9F0